MLYPCSASPITLLDWFTAFLCKKCWVSVKMPMISYSVTLAWSNFSKIVKQQLCKTYLSSLHTIYLLLFLMNIIQQVDYLEVVHKGKYIGAHRNEGYLTHQDSHWKSICFGEVFKHSLSNGQNNQKRPIVVCSLHPLVLPQGIDNRS